MSLIQTDPSKRPSNGFTREDEMKSSGDILRGLPINSSGLNGPDQVVPSEDNVTTKPNGRVLIKYDKLGRNNEVISIPGLLTRTAKKYPDQMALVSAPAADDTKKTWTYKEYEADVRSVAKAFLKLGLERYHSVNIIGFNSPEWFIADLAAIYAGGFAAGIYLTNSPKACLYCAESSRANIIVVEDENQLQKILQIKDKLPHLKAIIQYDGSPVKTAGVYSWDEIVKMGRAEADTKLDEVLKTIAVNECCTLVYTSGTVGHPKAVMLSHDNLIYDAVSIYNINNFVDTEEFLISYLPLSHVAAQVVDIFTTMRAAATVHFPDSSALKGTLLRTLVNVRPTQFLAVPRVWEKIYEKMMHVASTHKFFERWISWWAKSQGLKYHMNKMKGTDHEHWGYFIAKRLVFSNVKAHMGFDRCKTFFSAAAPLSVEIKRYFMSLDMPLMEVYGMSECSGAHTMSVAHRYRLGTLGQVMPGFKTKLDNEDSTGEGEICMAGRHIFMGYLNDPAKTREAVDKDGWLHSGDLGKLDSDGFLCVTGRIKELVITAGGENVPPVPIEQRLLTELPALSHAMLIGDTKKFLTILVTLKTDVNPDTGAPLDTLSEATRTWAESIGCTAKTVTEIIESQDPAVYKEIEEAIKRVNKHATSNAQRVQKFQILPHDFSVPTGELGPTFKLRRNVVVKKYADLIDEMYH